MPLPNLCSPAVASRGSPKSRTDSLLRCLCNWESWGKGVNASHEAHHTQAHGPTEPRGFTQKGIANTPSRATLKSMHTPQRRAPALITGLCSIETGVLGWGVPKRKRAFQTVSRLD